MILSILLTIFSLGVLIIFHEFGHFIIAKLLRIKVLQFSVGLGKEIFSKTIKDTKYSINILPLGGAVRLKGESLEDLDLEADSFFGKKWYQRSAVVIAGPIMNYILAVLIFTFVVYFFGITLISDEPVIGGLLEGKPAHIIGLKTNDRILKINGKQITKWSEMADIIQNSANKKISLEVMRNSEVLHFEIIPEEDSVNKRGIIGITPGYYIKKLSIIDSIKTGFYQPISLSIFSLRYLVEKISKLQKPDIAGPVGIFQVLTKAAKSGIENFLYTIGVISTMLALFNLFPIPILDGGHLVFCLLEAVTKKLPSKKLYEISNLLGLIFLTFLVLFATYNDILRK
ncbi:MAG: RIP metalloprotease RseP [Endomicrobia bacterium]|nr:RIP metalloprotease RseP [Endomicrobiia bacterium]